MRLSLALLTIALAAPAHAVTGVGKLWIVDHKPGAITGVAGVQAAIDAAQEGDTIRIRASPTSYAAPTIQARSLVITCPGSRWVARCDVRGGRAPTQPGQYASFCFQAAFLDASGVVLLAKPALVKVPL